MTSTRRMNSWRTAAWNLKARRKNNPGAPMRCSRTAKAIGSSFPRTERVETRPCGRGFPDAGLLGEMQESQHHCRDSRMNEIKAALFLARARVVDFHRLLFLAAVIFVPF